MKYLSEKGAGDFQNLFKIGCYKTIRPYQITVIMLPFYSYY